MQALQRRGQSQDYRGIAQRRYDGRPQSDAFYIDQLEADGELGKARKRQAAAREQQSSDDGPQPPAAAELLWSDRPAGQAFRDRAQEFAQGDKDGKNERVVKITEINEGFPEKWPRDPQ